MMRKTSIIVTTIALYLLSSWFVAPPAQATPTGCTSSTAWEHHYAGGLKSAAAWGVSANIETQTMDFCPSSGYSVWVSSVGFSGSNITGWAQMGYRQKTGMSAPYVYTEADSESNNYYYIQDWYVPTGFYTFKVDYVWTGSDSTSYWNFLANGTSQVTVSGSNMLWTPTQIQVYNELHDQGDQVAGTRTNSVSFSSVSMKTSKTGSYSSTTLTKDISSTITSHLDTNMTDPDNAWELWDTRY